MPNPVSPQPRASSNRQPGSGSTSDDRESWVNLSKLLLQLKSPPYFAVISDQPNTLFAPRSAREAIERGAQVTIYRQDLDLTGRATRPNPASAREIARTYLASSPTNRVIQAQTLTRKLQALLDEEEE